MALIGKIRNNSWLLIVMIGLGLGGFIIMDMFNSQRGILGGGNQYAMGTVDGTEIDFNEFQRTEQVLYGNQGGEMFSRRDYLWNYFLEKGLVDQTANELGLGVSRDELRDLQFGNNPSPIIQQRFRNQNTGQLDREQLNNIQRSLDNGELGKSQIGQFWAYQEKEIIKDRLETKLENMVSKAMFIPGFMIEANHKNTNNKVDFAYVQIPFIEVADLDVELSDSDYKNYLDANRSKYVSDEETRRLVYTTFDVIPTAQDSADIRKELTDLKADFASTDNDTTFTENNYGSLDGAYLKRAAINPDIVEQVMTGELGAVIGPYKEGNTYKVAKVLDRKIIPDSVKSRHILLQARTQEEGAAAVARIDSLKTLIETGVATFDTLAKQFGTDGTRSIGGDLGYTAANGMVKPLSDLIFYQAEEGELNTVITQYGIHLVEVTGRKFVNNDEGARIAYLSRPIVPSEATQKAFNEKALEFVATNRSVEDLKKAVEGNVSLSLQTTDPLKKNDFVVGTLGAGEDSRQIVKWSYSSDAEIGDVSPQVYVYQDPIEFYESKFVVVGLESIQAANKVDLANVKDVIKPLVMNQKKGEMLKAKITSQDLSALAGQYGSQVDTARGVSFAAQTVPGLGNEPAVIASAIAMGQGSTSQPIVGENGVYVIQVLAKNEIPVPQNIAQLRKIQSTSRKSQVSSFLMQAIKKEADIDDNRSKFY